MLRNYLKFFRLLNNYKIVVNSSFKCSPKVSLVYNKQFIRTFGTSFSPTSSKVDNKQRVKPLKINNVSDLFSYINNGKVFYLKQLVNIFPTINFDSLTAEEIITLLEQTSQVPDSSKSNRYNVCQDIFNKVQNNPNINLDIYHTYIQSCTENHIELDINDFIQNMRLDPDKTTLKLLLKNVCGHGNIKKALNILEIMKDKQIPVDEDTFNNLVLAHVLQGGLELAEEVLKTMKSAQIPYSTTTKLMILKGVSSRKDPKEFNEAIKKSSLQMNEDILLELLEPIGLNGNHNYITDSNIFNIELSRECQLKIIKLCIHLLHMDQIESSVKIYEKFVDPSVEQNYGFVLLKEMLHLNVDINTIIDLAKSLKDRELNLNAIDNLTDLALRHGYVEQAWALLSNLEVLRPHYFWPLLIIAKNTNGEKGLMQEMKKIANLNVQLDYESLEVYVFRFCDLTDPDLILKKIQTYGYTVKELLSPLIMNYLRRNMPSKAAYLCTHYNVSITGDQIMHELAFVWTATNDTRSVMEVAAKYCESNFSTVDHLGEFLKRVVDLCVRRQRMTNVDQLFRAVKERMLKINYSNADSIQHMVDSFNPPNGEDIIHHLRAITEMQIKTEGSYIPHPNDMTKDQLEDHLEELTEKKMETRGVLRRLIQIHSNEHNIKRVQELRNLFKEKGYQESAGMKSSIMHSLILAEDVDEALKLYKELKTQHPNFSLDAFKVLDLVHLLVKREDIENAVKILKAESQIMKKVNQKSSLGNCLRLLDSFKNTSDQEEVLNLLIKFGYCEPTNVILGPVIRLHMGQDLHKAVEKYTEFSERYRRTPLQFELLCKIIRENNDELTKKVLTASENVHGTSATFATYAFAMAETGETKKLTKFLTLIKFSLTNEMKKKCDRWIQEYKVEPMINLLNASKRIPSLVIDRNILYRYIMKYYSTQNDCESAIEFVNNIPEDDIIIRQDLNRDLNALLKKCNYKASTNVQSVNR